jgi:hypothetical protein
MLRVLITEASKEDSAGTALPSGKGMALLIVRERSMKKLYTMILITTLVGGFLTVTAFGQGRARGRFYSKSDVEKIIKRVETHSDEFKDLVDRTLDRSYLDGTRKEDNINEQVKQFERALDKLRSEFDKRDNWRETRDHVSKVLNQSDEVGRIVARNPFPPKVKAEWAGLRRDLNTLAGVYDLPRLKE